MDDGIILSKDLTKVDSFIQELRDAGFDLSVEDDYAGYLGVDIAPKDYGTIQMTQSGLIDRILVDLNLQFSKSSRDTPASESLALTRTVLPLTKTGITAPFWARVCISLPIRVANSRLPIINVLASLKILASLTASP